jgi:hypothetical protein
MHGIGAQNYLKNKAVVGIGHIQKSYNVEGRQPRQSPSEYAEVLVEIFHHGEPLKRLR